MRKLLLILFIVPLFGSFSFGSTEHNHSLNVSSIIEDPDFRGVWKDELGNYTMIWIDEYGKYQYLYMDGYRDVTKTLNVELIGNKLLVETVFLENNWKVTYILSLKNETTIYMEGRNTEESWNENLIRVNK